MWTAVTGSKSFKKQIHTVAGKKAGKERRALRAIRNGWARRCWGSGSKYLPYTNIGCPMVLIARVIYRKESFK